jgi:hypothetical protein
MYVTLKFIKGFIFFKGNLFLCLIKHYSVETWGGGGIAPRTHRIGG